MLVMAWFMFVAFSIISFPLIVVFRRMVYAIFPKHRYAAAHKASRLDLAIVFFMLVLCALVVAISAGVIWGGLLEL